MFDKLNEKRIYLDACLCGIIAVVLSLVSCKLSDAAFKGNVSDMLDKIFIFVPFVLLIVYSGLKGLVPGIVAFAEWFTVSFVLTFLFYLSGADSSFAFEMTKVLKFNFSVLFAFVSCVISGLVTTLSRKRVLSLFEGLCLFILLVIIFIF